MGASQKGIFLERGILTMWSSNSILRLITFTLASLSPYFSLLDPVMGPLLLIGNAKDCSDTSVVERVNLLQIFLEGCPAFRPIEKDRHHTALVDYVLYWY